MKKYKNIRQSVRPYELAEINKKTSICRNVAKRAKMRSYHFISTNSFLKIEI